MQGYHKVDVLARNIRTPGSNYDSFGEGFEWPGFNKAGIIE
jgi:hypothetical protein